MITRTLLGRTGLSVSRLGFGGASLAGATAAEADRLVGAALEAGVNLFDAAQCYGDAEVRLGHALRSRRAEQVLVTKCGHHEVLPDGSWRSRAISQADIDAALQRLGTDVIDVMLLHSCDLPLLQEGAALEVLRAARRAGKIRHFGYSGDNAAAAWAAAVPDIDIVEISYNVADQANAPLALAVARERNLGVLVKRALANAAWLQLGRPEEVWRDRHEADYIRRLGAMGAGPEAAPGGVAWPAAALAFVLGTPGIHAALVGSSQPERWRENALLAATPPGPDLTRWREAFRSAEAASGARWPALN